MNKAIEELPRGPAGSVQERTRMALITIADAINQVAQKVDPEKG